MGLEQERLYPFDRGVDTNPPRGWNPIDTSVVDRPIEPSGENPSREYRLQEIRFGVHQKDNKEGKEKEGSPKTDGFEPFVDPGDPSKPPQQKEGELFVNFYGGNYAQKMELNRKGVERALQIAHLDGQVFLTTFVPSRQRSAGIQGNELAARRNLFVGEKIEARENPLYRVVSVPQGWRIEVNDTRITEELTEKKLAGKKLQNAFINRFNTLLKKGFRECVWQEKLSDEKDKYFRRKLFWSGVNAAIPTSGFIMNPSATELHWFLGGIFIMNGAVNTLAYLTDQKPKITEDVRQKNNPNFKPRSFSQYRNIDNPLEVVMPFVEIDKVARTFAYLSRKGRKLVREVRGGKNLTLF